MPVYIGFKTVPQEGKRSITQGFHLDDKNALFVEEDIDGITERRLITENTTVRDISLMINALEELAPFVGK